MYAVRCDRPEPVEGSTRPDGAWALTGVGHENARSRQARRSTRGAPFRCLAVPRFPWAKPLGFRCLGGKEPGGRAFQSGSGSAERCMPARARVPGTGTCGALLSGGSPAGAPAFERTPFAMTIQLKRVYDSPEPTDGARYLVDRLWPRGVSKAALVLTGWLKELAPSHELRRWFGHDPSRWEEFRRRYWEELQQNPCVDQIVPRLAQHGCITLLYAASDPLHNHAVVLREFLVSRMGNCVPSGGSALLSDLSCGSMLPPHAVDSGPAQPPRVRPRWARRSRSPRRSVP